MRKQHTFATGIVLQTAKVPNQKSRTPSLNLVGARICKMRSLHRDKLTQDQLAGRLAALGLVLDRSTIAKIETGRRRVYDFEVVAFAKALGVTGNWLLGLTDKSSPKSKKGFSDE